EPAAPVRRTPTQAPLNRHAGAVVMLVEDDDDVRASAAAMLEKLGLTVLEARDGAAALTLLEARADTALLFTDVGLPGKWNGRQLAEEAVRRVPTLKVLYTSGYARNAIVHSGRLDAGVQLLSKPYTFGDLTAKVIAVLDG